MSSGPDSYGPAATGGGTVYLIHFDEPYKHARHYLGWARDLAARMKEHRNGRGARLMEVIKDAGITWRVARTWPGTRDLERAIKERHNTPRLCPECTPAPQPVTRGRSAAQLALKPPPQRQETVSWAQVPQQEPGGSQVTERPPEKSAVEIVPGLKPWTGLPSPWPGRPAPASLYRELWDVTEQLTNDWLSRQRDPEPQPEPGIG